MSNPFFVRNYEWARAHMDIKDLQEQIEEKKALIKEIEDSCTHEDENGSTVLCSKDGSYKFCKCCLKKFD